MRLAGHVVWLRGEKCIKIFGWGDVRKQQSHIFGIIIEILTSIGCDSIDSIVIIIIIIIYHIYGA